MSKFHDFLDSLDRSVGETYQIYNEVDHNAAELISIAKDGVISGESDNPIYLRFKSYLVGQTDLISDSAVIHADSGNTQLMCRLFFVTSLHILAVDVVIDTATLKVKSDIAYCEKSTENEYGDEDDYLNLPDQTYDELNQIARSISLLGRINTS
jgi:hypothetical protein